MKHKLSVTLDEELVRKIFGALSTGKYRNKSHVVEYAVQKLLEGETSPVKIEATNHKGDLDG